MKTGAAFFLKHHGKSKKLFDRKFAAEHLYYIARDAATTYTFAQHMPQEKLFAARFMTGRWDNAKRKDARLWDDIILNLPYSLSEEQRQQAVLRFILDVTKGRTPVWMAIHNDTNAPHAHIIFIDADVETNKRVFGTSEAGSSYRLRWIWEQVLNDALREADVHLQVSRRGKAWQRAQQAAANDNSTALSPALYHEERNRMEHLATIAREAPKPIYAPTVDAPKSTQAHGAPATEPAHPEKASGSDRSPQAPVAHADEQPHDALKQHEDAMEPNKEAEQAIIIDPAATSMRGKVYSILQRADDLDHILAKRDHLNQLRRDYTRAKAEVDQSQQRLDRLSREQEEFTNLHSKAVLELRRFGPGLKLLTRLPGLKKLLRHKKVAIDRARSNAEQAAALLEYKNRMVEAETATLKQRMAAQFVAEKAAEEIKDTEAVYGDEKDFETAIQIHKHSLIIDLGSLDPKELIKMYEGGEISDEHHAKLSKLHSQYIAQYEAGFTH